MRIPFWRSKRENDLEKEIRSHLEMSAEDQIERGVSPEEATAAARRHLGNQSHIKELTRQSWGWMWLERLGHDLRYGLRALKNSPVFSIVAIIVLAVGIGANSAIFSVVNGVLLRPLPVKDQKQIVWVWGKNIKDGGLTSLSYPDFEDWRSRSHAFSKMAAAVQASYTLTGDGPPERVQGWIVSADLFPLLGIQPMLGRTFTADEEHDVDGKGQVAIVTNSLWRRHFGSDPKVIGKTMVLANKSVTVIGVMPAGFRFLFSQTEEDVDLWLPLGNKLRGQYELVGQTMLSSDKPGIDFMTKDRNVRLFFAIARLNPGFTKAAAQTEMDSISTALREEHPDTNQNVGVLLMSVLEPLVADSRTSLLIIFAAVGLVLLIACGNVANLLLARGLARQREIAIRTALGASRKRIIRQLLTESVLLSMFGCGLGLLLAFWGIRFLVTLGEEIPRVEEVKIDGTVLAFTVLISLITGLLFGLIPAVQVSRVDLSQAVKEGGASNASLRGGFARSSLIVFEVALTLILLTGAGLLIQSFANLRHVNLGFNAEKMLTFHFDLPGERYTDQKQIEFQRELQQRLQALPGVTSASTAFALPMIGFTFDCNVEIEGQGAPEARGQSVNFLSASPNYFQTMEIPILKGRGFDDRDSMKAPKVVIVSQSMARKYFPSEDPIGKRVRPSVQEDGKDPVYREIVGVVGDVRQENHRTDPKSMLYLPGTQVPMNSVALVRTSVDPLSLVGAIRNEVKAIDSELPIYDVRSMDQSIKESLAQDKFNTLVLSIFAAIALFLTGIGLYGVLAYSVTQRTREIGIRMALGAQRQSVLRMVVGHGLKLALIGTVIGFAGSLATTRLIREILFGVGTEDPATMIGVTVVIVAMVALACLIPGWRATRVDPVVALRCE